MIYQFCGKYGHILAIFSRIHLRGRYKNWKKFGPICFKCQKVSHLRKDYLNQASTPNVEKKSEKEKVNTEEVRSQMNQTWKRKTEGENN